MDADPYSRNDVLTLFGIQLHHAPGVRRRGGAATSAACVVLRSDLPGSNAASRLRKGRFLFMKKIYLTVDDHLTEISTLEKGCWVHLQNPTREEIEGLNARFALDPTYLQAALDEEESARIERQRRSDPDHR